MLIDRYYSELARSQGPAATACSKAPPESKDGDAIVRLVEESQRGVVNQHRPPQVPAYPGEVLDAGVQVT